MSIDQPPTTDDRQPNSSPNYSIIIPAYNEGERLSATLEKVLAHVAERGWSAEVIVVNDGSRDNTAEIIRGFAERDPRLQLVGESGQSGQGIQRTKRDAARPG